MKNLSRCCRQLAIVAAMTGLLTTQAFAASHTKSHHKAVFTPSPALAWCVDDLCLGQPESVLKPYSAQPLPLSSQGMCAATTHRYAIPRTDGSLEVVVSGNKIVELLRGYADTITPDKFDKMLKETPHKLSAQIISKTPLKEGALVKLHNDSLKASAELSFAPKNSVPLTVKLVSDHTPEACVPEGYKLLGMAH